MRRLVIFGSLVLAVIGLLLSGIPDTSTSIADTSVPDSEVTSNLSEANNSSASAAITITMRTPTLPEE